MLRCPVCQHTEMVILELNAIEVDHCISCGGVWLDAGEIGLLLDDPEKEDSFNRLLTDAGERCVEQKRPCPICGTTMSKCGLEEKTPGLILDRCPRGHGFWFDADELRRLLESPSCNAAPAAVALVKEMFASRIPNH